MKEVIASAPSEARQARRENQEETATRQMCLSSHRTLAFSPQSSLPQFGGGIIVGEQTLTYHNGEKYRSIAMNNTIMKCYCQIDRDGSRCALFVFLFSWLVCRRKINPSEPMCYCVVAFHFGSACSVYASNA